VRKQLADVSPRARETAPLPTVVIADTTFWGKEYGVCVFRSPGLKKNIWWSEVLRETNATYHYGRKILEERGWTFTAAVVDGRRGLTSVFKGMPVQMCHFHQVARVRRYVTRRPATVAGRELLDIVYTLRYTNEHTFTLRLEAWQRRWGAYIAEHTQCERCRRTHYTHKDVRGAYQSLKTNLPFCLRI
jgi:hypothetical protein